MMETGAMGDKPRIIVFDWGGVILRICRSFDEGCARAGLDVRAAAMTPERIAARRKIAERYQRGEIDCTAWATSVSESTGGVYTPEEVQRIHDAWLIDEYPGVSSIIDDLHTAGVHTALLSNTNARHWARHLPTGTAEADFPTIGMLRHRHASHLLGHAKPDEAIYRAFERETDHRGGELLFFDDLIENIQQARGCGWLAHQIDHEGDTAEQMRTVLKRFGVL